MWLRLALTLALPALLAATPQSRPVLRLFGSKPDTGVWPSGLAVTWGCEQALRDIRQLDPFPFDIEVEWHNDNCARQPAMRELLDSMSAGPMRQTVHGVLGAGCSSACLGLADLSPLWGIPVHSWGCTSPDLSDTMKYPFFSRIEGTDTASTKGWVYLAATFGWRRLASMVEREDSGLTNLVQVFLREWAPVEVPEVELVVDYHFHVGSSPEAVRSAAREVAAARTRIVVLNAYEGCTTIALCAFRKEGLDYGGWVFLTYGWHFTGFLSRAAQSTECSLDEVVVGGTRLLGVLSGMWSLDPSHVTPGGSKPQEMKQAYYTHMENASVPPTDYASMLYDAVWVFALGMQAHVKQYPGFLSTFDNHNISEDRTTYLTSIHEKVLGLDFIGATGRVHFDERGDRVVSIEVRQCNVREEFVVKGFCSGVSCTFIDAIDFGLSQPYDPAEPNIVEGRVPAGEPRPCPSPWELRDVITDLCEECPPGRVLQSVSCICEVGYFSNSSNGDACELCPPGHSCGLSGLVAPRPCAAGFFSAASGAASCTPCHVGTYVAEEGSTACTSCAPEGSTAPHLWMSLKRPAGMKEWLPAEGLTSVEACGCAGGSFLQGGDCKPCIEGMTCLGKDHVELEPGFFSTPQEPGLVWRCWSRPERCPGGPLGTCAHHRDNTSLACTRCVPGTTPDSGTGACKRCSATDFLPIVCALIAFVVVLCIVYYVARTHDRARQKRDGVVVALCLGQIFTVSQQLGVLSYVNAFWPSPLKEVLSICTLISFDLSILPLDCAVVLSPFAKFAVRILVIFAMFLVLFVIHTACAFVLSSKSTLGRGRASAMVSTASTSIVAFGSSAGLAMMMLFLSILSGMLSPLQCQWHPNGLSTVRDDDAVICWSEEFSSGHKHMVSLSMVSCIFPLAFMAIACRATIMLPSKISQGEVGYLRKYFFLFSRFRVDCHWYVIYWIWRNALVAIVPAIPSAVAQIFVLSLTMQSSMVISVFFLPWRCREANILDIVCTYGLLFVIGSAALLIDGVDRSVVGFCALAALCALLVALFGCLSVAVYRRFLRRGRPFQFFICHHKVGAGNLARLMKMHLMDFAQVRRKVFVDSDNLTDLNTLFDCVKSQTDTVVVLCSHRILYRAWCVGEITTASQHKVVLQPVLLPDFHPPGTAEIRAIAHLPDIKELAGFGISSAVVEDTLVRFMRLGFLDLPDKVDNPAVRHAAEQLVFEGKRSCRNVYRNALPMSVFDSMNPDTDSLSGMRKAGQEAHVAIVSDQRNSEAACSACVLQKLLAPLIALQGEGISCHMLAEEEELPTRVEQVIAVCTNGCFERPRMGLNLLAASSLQCVLLPVITEPGFRFPSEGYLKEIKASFESGMFTEGETKLAAGLQAEMFITVVSQMFKEIAIEVNPQDHESVLHLRVQAVAHRLKGLEKHKGSIVHGRTTQSFARRSAFQGSPAASASTADDNFGVASSEMQATPSQPMVAIMSASSAGSSVAGPGALAVDVHAETFEGEDEEVVNVQRAKTTHLLKEGLEEWQEMGASRSRSGQASHGLRCEEEAPVAMADACFEPKRAVA